ncbi:MAG: hypothetical protein V3R98_05730 [Alphaproteobacteria bacterium]
MIVVRGIGWALLLLAVLVLVYGGLIWRDGVAVFEMTGGEHWFTVDLESLNLAQALIQRYLIPSLWDPVLVSVLLWPVAGGLALVSAVLAVPGLVLLLAFRRRRRHLVS